MVINKEHIEDFEYSFCEDEEIILEEGCKTIGYKSLSACEKLKKLKLPESLECINDKAFYDCKNLEEVYIGSNVNFIGSGIFKGCEKLKTIKVSENNQHFISLDNILYSKNLENLICFPGGKIQSSYETLPEIKIISEYAFSDNPYIRDIIINKNVKTIKQFAFNHCINLNVLIILDFINIVEENVYNCCDNIQYFYCLSNCKLSTLNSLEKLEHLYISGNLDIDFDNEYLRTHGFLKECQLINNNIKLVNNDNFILENNTILSKDKTILYRVLPNTEMEEYICPSEVKIINKWAFKYCKKIKHIKLNEGLEIIDLGAFENCDFEEIEIPSTVKRIEDFAFTWCYNLKKIKLNNGMEYIGSAVFKECKQLDDVIVPSSISNVGRRIFQSCNNLKNVVMNEFVYNKCEEIFYDCTNKPNITFIKDNIQYKYNENKEIIITKYVADDLDIIIPRLINGNPVKEIKLDF